MLLPELPFQFVCETGDRVYTVTHWREGELVVNWVDSSGMKEHTTYDPVDVLKLFLEGSWILLASTEAPTELEELEARIETLEEYITQLVRENKKLKEKFNQLDSLKDQADCYSTLQALISKHESYSTTNGNSYSEDLQGAIIQLQDYWDKG